jgi:hypothetical protein
MAATEKLLKASGVLYTDRRNFYVDPQVTKELWTDVAPFTTLISNQEMRKVPDPVFKMFEHRNPWVKQKFVINNGGGYTIPDDDTGVASVAIDGIVGLASSADSSYVGLVVEIWNSAETTNRGCAVITASSTTLTLKSLANGAISVSDDDICYIVGSAHGEGSSAPEAWSDELSVVFNSCQIFKTPLQITGTLQAAVLRGESSELARLRRLKGQEHKMQKEKAFLFGMRDDGTGLDLQDGSTSDSFNDAGRSDADGNLIRTTYGIVSAINQYGDSSGDDQSVFTVDGSYAYGDFVDDMEKVFQYVPESGVKRAFCGAGALGYWSKMAGSSGLAGNSGWTVSLGDMKRDSLGFNYRVLETPHGMLQLIPTPALRGPYNKYMVAVSDENLFHAQYRPQQYQTNIKTDNAFDAVKDQYMSDEGVGIQLIESHHLFKITA